MLKRSFLLLVTLGLVIEGAATYLAWQAALSQLPCHWAMFSLRLTSPAACVRAVPIIGRRAWLSAVLIGLADLISISRALFELGRQLNRAHRLRRTLDVMPRQSLPPALTGHRRLQIVVSGERLCFCIGLWAPTVVISSRLLEELHRDELAAAIAHETSHQMRFDPLRLLVAAVTVRALFFLPASGDLGRASRIANELAADDVATRRFGRRALVGALRTIQDGTRPSSSMTSMASSDLLSERVAALSGECVPLHLPPSRLALSAIGLIAVIGVGVSIPSATTAPQPLPVHRVTVVRVPSPSHAARHLLASHG